MWVLLFQGLVVNCGYVDLHFRYSFGRPKCPPIWSSYVGPSIGVDTFHSPSTMYHWYPLIHLKRTAWSESASARFEYTGGLRFYLEHWRTPLIEEIFVLDEAIFYSDCPRKSMQHITLNKPTGHRWLNCQMNSDQREMNLNTYTWNLWNLHFKTVVSMGWFQIFTWKIVVSPFPTINQMFFRVPGTYKTIEQWKNPGWLGYIGDYTTQLYRDYNKPL